MYWSKLSTKKLNWVFTYNRVLLGRAHRSKRAHLKRRNLMWWWRKSLREILWFSLFSRGQILISWVFRIQMSNRERIVLRTSRRTVILGLIRTQLLLRAFFQMMLHLEGLIVKLWTPRLTPLLPKYPNDNISPHSTSPFWTRNGLHLQFTNWCRQWYSSSVWFYLCFISLYGNQWRRKLDSGMNR